MAMNSITLANLMNSAVPSDTAELIDENGIFTVEQTENGCCLKINSEENCMPVIMSAIAKYAETHADFDANLVKFEEPDDNDEPAEDEPDDEIDRSDVDKNFTVINTDNGSKMIWNKAENKAFAFSIDAGYDGEQNQRIYKDVIEMKYCKHLSNCVYAYSLDDEKFADKIGLVDVQTGVVIAPQFSKLIISYFDLFESQFIGLTVDKNENVIFSAINTEYGLNIVNSAACGIRFNSKYEEYHYLRDSLYDNDFKLDEEWIIDITSQDSNDDDDLFDRITDNKIAFKSVKSCSEENCLKHWGEGENWVKWMIVDCSKLFRGEEYLDIYFAEDKLDITNSLQLRYTRSSVPRYSIGDMDYEYAKPIDYEFPFYIVSKNGKYAFLQSNKLLTGYDFTSKPSRIHNKLYLVEIYGKFGLMSYERAILPIEFSSIKYYDKIEYSHNDNDGQSDSIILKEAFVVNKLGMCAIFTTDCNELIKQVTPFCREDELTFKEIKED